MRPEDYVRQEAARTANESIFASFGRTIRDIVANVQEIMLRGSAGENRGQGGNHEPQEGIFFGAKAICSFYAVGFILLVTQTRETLLRWCKSPTLLVGLALTLGVILSEFIGRRSQSH